MKWVANYQERCRLVPASLGHFASRSDSGLEKGPTQARSAQQVRHKWVLFAYYAADGPGPDRGSLAGAFAGHPGRDCTHDPIVV
jgi:hypothetical protein